MKAPKYIVCIDYKATFKPLTLDYYDLSAGNLLDAMNEAEKYLDEEKVYLITVMEKKGQKALKGWQKGAKAVTYSDILTNRGCGWHSADAAHSEQAFEKELWFDSEGNHIA